MKRRLATLTVIAVAGSILVSILAVSFLAKPEVRELGFHTPVNLSESKTNAFEQKIAAVDSDVYVVWREARRVALDDVSLSYYDIIFRASNDGGKSFGAKINLSNGTQSEESPLVAAAGNQVYLTWKAVDPVERTYPLFFRASDDHGKTFGDIIRITATGESAAGFDVAAASDTVIIAYESYIDDVVYKLRASHDNGVSFAQPIDYYQPRCAGAGIDVETSVDGNHVYLTAGDSCAPEGGDEILFRKSDDGGVSLGSVKRIDLGNYQQLEAVGKEKLFLSWRNLQGNVMLAASVDGGTTFNS
ncbi:MAG: sialidase family protein, partial [Nitrososphaera sp.]